VANQPWLEQFRAQLGKEKLPAAYVERLVEEISDHWQDLREENMPTELEQGVRMGEPGQVAALAGCTYGRRLLRRRPVLAFAIFVLSPLPILVLLSLAMLYAAGLGLEKWQGAGSGHSLKQTLNPAAMDAAIAAVLVLSTGLLTAGFGRLAERAGLTRRWAVASGLILCLAVGLTIHQVKLSDTLGQSSIELGLGWGAYRYKLWQAVQLSLGLALCFLVLRRRPRTSRQVGTVKV